MAKMTTEQMMRSAFNRLEQEERRSRDLARENERLRRLCREHKVPLGERPDRDQGRDHRGQSHA